MDHKDLCSGTFCRQRDEKDVEFYSGVCGDMAKELKDTCWSMKTKVMDDGRVGAFLCCKQLPQYNMFDIFTEGCWNQFDCAAWGGKGKLKFCKTKDGYETEVCTEAFGKMDYVEKYTPEGLHYTITHKGKSHDEFWARHIKTCGSYKYEKDENLCNFMKKAGMPETVIACMKDYKFCWKEASNGCITNRECFGSAMTVCHTFKLNEEFETKFPLPGFPSGRAVYTKQGPGKYTCFIKVDGSTEEWCFDFCDQGCYITGKSQKTGESCKLWMKRYANFAGTWKPVAIVNVKEGCEMMGMPSGEACKLGNEYDLRVKIECKGVAQRFCWDSKICPMDVVFKFGQEYEVYDPLLKENSKCVTTCCGNTWTTVSKSSKFSFVTTTTVGDTFMICESKMCGCPVSCPMQYIFERC